MLGNPFPTCKWSGLRTRIAKKQRVYLRAPRMKQATCAASSQQRTRQHFTISRLASLAAWRLFVHVALRLVGIAFVFERLDHVAISIVNANHDWIRPAERLCIAHCIDDRV